jgi:hypothetical protein
MSGQTVTTVGVADVEAETISYGRRVDGDGRRVRTLRGSLPGGAGAEAATRSSLGGGDNAVTVGVFESHREGQVDASLTSIATTDREE